MLQTIMIEKFRRSFPFQSKGKKYIQGLVYLIPWLLGLLLFKLAPIIASMVLSTTDFFLLTPEKVQFVGLQNYFKVLMDPNTALALWRTIRLGLYIIPFQTSAAILLAALLSSHGLWGKNLIRALFFLPSIIPSVAATFMWQGFVNPSSGWLHRLLLNPLGLGDLVHLSARGNSQAFFIITSLWMIGPGFLIIMGAMQGINPEILEASTVDGAGRGRRFFSITLPLVSPAIFFTLVLNLTAIFGGAIILDRGYNLNSNVSSYDGYIYSVLFRSFKLGYASSLAWVFFVFTMLLVLVFFYTSKWWVYFPDQEKS